MLSQAFRKVTKELEDLTKHDISLERAIDLFEASTQDLEELVIINTIRETLFEDSYRLRADETEIIFPPNAPNYYEEPGVLPA